MSKHRSVSKKWCKDTRTEGEKLINAWDSWIKGCPTPRILQRELNISKGTLYRNWLIMNSPKRRREEADG